MSFTEMIPLILSVLAGLATAIPLTVKLVEYVRRAVREKNWNSLLRLVMDLMAEAEAHDALLSGADRRAWVLASVASLAHTLEYDVDLVAVGTLIDELCALTKEVNYDAALD